MLQAETARQATVLLYADDRTVRDQVKVALGRRVAMDLPELTIVETATRHAAMDALDAGGIDLVIADGEAVPLGGMGLSKQIRAEVPNHPPVLLLVARTADAWLATWSEAEAVVSYPIDPVRLPAAVAELLRARLAGEAAAQ